jgi:hypothetical protein
MMNIPLNDILPPLISLRAASMKGIFTNGNLLFING